VFEGLVEAVRDLEVPVDGAALRTLFTDSPDARAHRYRCAYALRAQGRV
jgi:hypothetical protein